MKQELTITVTPDEAGTLRRFFAKLVRDCPVDAGPEAGLADLADAMRIMLCEVRALLPGNFTAEPAYDMLLLLFCVAARGEQVTVTRLGSSVGLPHATAARRVSALCAAGLIELQQDGADRRRRFVRLSEVALGKMTIWLEFMQAAAAAKAG